MNNNTVLLIFEGIKTEHSICNSLRKHFIDKPSQTTIQTSYGFDIYRLFKQLEQDDGLTLLGIIQEELDARQTQNKLLSEDDLTILRLEDSDTISDIYLFFDYDPHNRSASDDKIQTMLNRFESSTDEGKLFISYPMLESLRHIKNPQEQNTLYPINKVALLKYKGFSAHKDNIDLLFQDWGRYDLSIWSTIIVTHLKRASVLVNDEFTMPDSLIEQVDIFESQQSKHLPNHQVAVICAFPLMLHEYYANNLWDKLAPLSSD